MAQYEKIFEKPYEDGYEDLPSQNTPITAQTLNDKDTAIEHIEDFLDGKEVLTPTEKTDFGGAVNKITENEQKGYLKSINLWDEQWENGYYDSSGNKGNNGVTTYLRSKNLIPCTPNQSYYIKAISENTKILYYDSDGQFIERVDATANATFTSINNAYYMQFWVFDSTPNSYATYNHNICINIDSALYNGTYMQYAPSNIELANSKADITSIGIDESGRTTASKAYAIGEHFYKDGKFCTAKTAIASGATFTLNTNYVEGDVSSTIDSKITDQLTADSGGTIQNQACVTLGHIFIAVYVITTGASSTSTVVSGFPTLATQSNAPTALIRNLSNGQVVTSNNYIVNGKHTMTGLSSSTSYTVTIIGII